MQAVIFIGIQATGKSTFYREQFFHTHMRINLDMLKTRHREKLFLHTSLNSQQAFVVDNTNVTVETRSTYIKLAKQHHFEVVGYYFQSIIVDAIKRNANRTGAQHIPEKAIPGTAARLELPSYDEGYDKLYYVRIDKNNEFVIEAWQDEV